MNIQGSRASHSSVCWPSTTSRKATKVISSKLGFSSRTLSAC